MAAAARRRRDEGDRRDLARQPRLRPARRRAREPRASGRRAAGGRRGSRSRWCRAARSRCRAAEPRRRRAARADARRRALAAARVPAVAGRRRRWSRWSAALRARGFEILLAHPERSPTIHPRPRRARAPGVDRARSRQVTSGSFAGDFGEHGPPRRVRDARARPRARPLLRRATTPRSARPSCRGARRRVRRRYDDADAQFEWMTVDAPGRCSRTSSPPPRPAGPRGLRDASELMTAITRADHDADHDQHLDPDPEGGHPPRTA